MISEFDGDSLEANARVLREAFQQIVRGMKGVDAHCTNDLPQEMNIQEMRVLEILGDRGSCIMRELADGLLVPVSTATGIVDKLVQKDLVHRERVDEDRRIVRAALSDSGRELYSVVQGRHLTFCRKMLAALNPAEQESLLLLMRKVAREASRRPEAEPVGESS